jgi:uncharacterized repeat protein (TIGR01451 family)
MRKSTIAIGIAAALSTQAFVTATNADAAVKNKPLNSNRNTSHQLPRFVFPHHSPNGSGVLYDQSGSAVNGAPSQNFESSFDQYDAQGADDFVVTDAGGWTVTGFNFQISATSDPSSATYDVFVLPDAGGVPGASPVCSAPAAAGVLGGGNTTLSVTLPSACSLSAGTYWVEMVVNLDFLAGGQVFWSDFGGGSGSNAKWQNPGQGFGSGCATWSDMASCVSSSGSAVGGGQPAFLFQVVGTTGGGGSCGAGDLCLEATVGTDTSAGACGTDSTIDATVGDQLNFCYTITNNTGIELDYHSLANNVDGPLFTLMNQPVPAGGTFQYNNIETVSETATYNSTWTGQDLPPGYASEVTSGGGGGCADRIFADGFDGTTVPCDTETGFIDITGTGTPLNNGDDQAVAVTMPFSFNFYGTTSNNICVDNNGFVLFNTTACPSFGHYTNVSLPSTTLSAPAMMPMWDDFDSESGNVYTDTRGSSPNRQFIVEWFDRVHYSGSSNTDGATFELIFNEDGTIQFEYSDVEFTGGSEGDCSGGACATIGLQNDETLYNQFSAFEASVTDNSGIKWTATTPQVFTGTDSVQVNVGAPDINVNPASLSGTVSAGGSTTTPLDIQNLGDRDLVWTADEAPPADFHFPYGPRYAPSTLRPGETNVSALRPSQEWLRAHHQESKPGQRNAHAAPLGVAGTPSYGCSIISSSSCDYVSFDADAPGTLNSIATENELMFGASFVADDFTKEYIVGYPSGDLETIDTATGVRTTIGPTGQGTATRDIAYDLQTGTLFGTAIDGSGTDLFTVDTTTGAMTLVGPITGLGSQAYVMGLAVNPNTGLMYGIEIVSSSLVAIDKTTGAATTIGPLGYSTRFGQGLDFNAATGVLYLASIDYGAGGSQNMYTVDLDTGAATLIGPIGNNIIQLGAFGIAVPSGPCGTPADQPWLSLNPTSGTTGPGSDTPVTVTIDATGASDGDVLSGTVCVRSNDPDEHVVAVPISVNVTNAPPPPVPPTVTKSFNPTQVTPGESSTLTITLSNNAGVDSMLTASLTDNLPPGMDIAIPPQAATTCGGAVSSTAQSVTLDAAGSTIPAGGSCTVEVNVTVGGIGTFDNVIPAAALQTSTGDNANAATATLASHVPPTISKEFNPQTVAVDAPSTLTITIANIDPGAATLTAPLVDAFPAGLVVAPAPNEATTCSGGLTANGGADSIMLDTGAIVPSGGCTITVNVVASAAGSYANDIPAGALQTDFGTNATPADATLDVN